MKARFFGRFDRDLADRFSVKAFGLLLLFQRAKLYISPKGIAVIGVSY